MKSPRREAPELLEAQRPATADAVKARIARHLQNTPEDHQLELGIAVGELAEYVAQLLAWPLAEKRPLQIHLQHVQSGIAAGQVPDLALLAPLAARDTGIVLDSLQLEISVRNAFPSGLATLLKQGHALRRLCLMFVHPHSLRAPLLGQYVKQCLQSRSAPLDTLGLLDFEDVLPPYDLKDVFERGRLSVKILALGASTQGQCVPDYFYLADLLGHGLHCLQLQGMTLSAASFQGLAQRMERDQTLRGLRIERCVLTGNSEPLFCALLANRSLRSLMFLNNQVQSPQITPARFLRVLQNQASLQNLHVEDFDDPAFRKHLADLRQERPHLRIVLHSCDAQFKLDPPVRRGWGLSTEAPEPKSSPATMKTPEYQETESDDA